MTTLLQRPQPTEPLPDPTRLAIRDILPILVSVVPFAMTIGVTISTAPINDLAGWLGGPLIAAGSAHMTVVGLAGTGASNLAIIATALLINARLAAYSAALAPIFRNQPRWFRWVAPHLIVDQTFVLAEAQRDRPTAWMRRYWGMLVVPLIVTWVAAITVGLLAGPVIPAAWKLSFTVPLIFAGMAAPGLKGRPSVNATVVGAGAAFVLSGLPSGLGLLVAIIAGTLAGAMTDRSDS